MVNGIGMKNNFYKRAPDGKPLPTPRRVHPHPLRPLTWTLRVQWWLYLQCFYLFPLSLAITEINNFTPTTLVKFVPQEYVMAQYNLGRVALNHSTQQSQKMEFTFLTNFLFGSQWSRSRFLILCMLLIALMNDFATFLASPVSSDLNNPLDSGFICTAV